MFICMAVQGIKALAASLLLLLWLAGVWLWVCTLPYEFDMGRWWVERFRSLG